MQLSELNVKSETNEAELRRVMEEKEKFISELQEKLQMKDAEVCCFKVSPLFNGPYAPKRF